LLHNDTTGGALLVAANTITAPLWCAANSPAPVNIELANTVRGPKIGQCEHL
jgi:hypothetical protein